MQYRKSLDGVRGLAILLVVFFHYNFLIEVGWVGVQLFFVLSGYLITSILLEDKKQSLDVYLKGFYWRRTLRIFPVYYLYLFVVALLFLVAHIPENFRTQAPFLFTYTYNLYPFFHDFSFDLFFTHFWSLSIEEQFYLLWPLVIYFLNTRSLQIVLLAIMVGAPVTRYLIGEYLIAEGRIAPEFIGEVVYRFTLGQWDSFAFGAAIPLFRLDTVVKRPGLLLASSAGVLVLCGVFNYISLHAINPRVGITSLGYPIGSLVNGQHLWSYTVLGVASMALIIYTIRRRRIPVFDNSVMVFFGKLSYGLYVYHWFLKGFYGKYLEPRLPEPLGFIVYLGLCIGVSYASYRIIEQPLLSLKDRFFVRKPVPEPASSVKA